MDFTTIEKFCISNFYTDIHEITLPDDVAKPRFAESLSGNYNVRNFLKNLDRRYGITTRTRSQFFLSGKMSKYFSVNICDASKSTAVKMKKFSFVYKIQFTNFF